MGTFREGTVVSIVESLPQLVRAQVEMDSGTIAAVGFPSMIGPVRSGDRVVVNTTALELGLGTGGEGFLLWNLDGAGSLDRGPGHIIKMRYTPWQTEVASVEAPESSHHSSLEKIISIEGMPVIACGLHSQIAGVAAGIREKLPEAVIAYVMTDAGSLPLAWSNLVRTLQSEGFIDVTCTVGHAFGGDLEAVNVFSGLAAARVVGRADVAIVAMGPGVVGTDTVLGFSGIEQGQVLDAAAALHGKPVASLRVSFSDQRPRHYGVSHHTVTALTVASRSRATVVVPDLPPEQSEMLWAQLRSHGLADRHRLVGAGGDGGLRLLEEAGVDVRSMGRPMKDEREAILAAAAAGAIAAGAISATASGP
jgi:Protein of unknown function (DUF3866)